MFSDIKDFLLMALTVISSTIAAYYGFFKSKREKKVEDFNAEKNIAKDYVSEYRILVEEMTETLKIVTDLSKKLGEMEVVNNSLLLDLRRSRNKNDELLNRIQELEKVVEELKNNAS